MSVETADIESELSDMDADLILLEIDAQERGFHGVELALRDVRRAIHSARTHLAYAVADAVGAAPYGESQGGESRLDPGFASVPAASTHRSRLASGPLQEDE